MFGGSLRLLRVWPLGPACQHSKNGRRFSLGVGGEMELSSVSVAPILRARVKVCGPLDAWVHLCPQPEIKLKGLMALPSLVPSPSVNNLMVGAVCHLPFTLSGLDPRNARFLVQVRWRSNVTE